NGIFDSKVLSQKHAKIWCEGNQVLIKDLDSSNGTIVNDYPLVAGEVFELETDDIIEFGVDL
ncbi:SMAD/FHA domain-containing protein, partial [Chytridium lagenaria]